MVRVATGLLATALVISMVLIAQHPGFAQAGQTAATNKVAMKMTDAQKAKNEMTAAPQGLSKNATIMDWPDKPNGKPRQLRAGSNGWVCYPSTPEMHHAVAGDDPMCLDKSWQDWAGAT